MSTYFEVTFRYKFVGDLGDDAAHDSGVEEGDIGDPEHAENEWAHEDGKITTPGGGGPVPTRVQARNVGKINIGKFILENSSKISKLFSEFGLQSPFHFDFWFDGHFLSKWIVCDW